MYEKRLIGWIFRVVLYCRNMRCGMRETRVACLLRLRRLLLLILLPGLLALACNIARLLD